MLPSDLSLNTVGYLESLLASSASGARRPITRAYYFGCNIRRLYQREILGVFVASSM